MKVVAISEFGGPEVLKVEERELPDLKVGQVLIHVKAAGVNRPDIFQRKGNYPAPSNVAADIPGLEVSGIIVDVENEQHNHFLNKRVMALVSGGGYAEYVAVDYRACIEIPGQITFEEAAGMPETIYTVWHNVFQRGSLQVGQSLLVHGGAGGIGSTAIQLANLRGNKVYTTVGSANKVSYTEDLGAYKAINYQSIDFEEYLKDEKVDVILDSVGGAYFNKNINVLKEDGRLVYINAMSGSKVELNLLKMMQKRIHISGSTLRNRTDDFKADLTAEIKKEVLPLIEQGLYKTNIAQVFNYMDAKEAHKLMESRNFMGKIILSFSS